MRALSKRDALDAYGHGRITLREFAAALSLRIWNAHDLLLAEGVAAAQGRFEETRLSLEELVQSGSRSNAARQPDPDAPATDAR